MKRAIFFTVLTIFVIILSVPVFNGCRSFSEKADDMGEKSDFGIQIMTVDDCEYAVFVSSTNGSPAMVHHGNCHNPVHKKDTTSAR